jgi:hypothetical protein
MLCRLVTRCASLRRPARAVAVWAVLAGLFLMHGAASPAGGCCGGTPATAMTATAMTAMPAMPAAAPAGAGVPPGPCASSVASAAACTVPAAAVPAAATYRPARPPGKAGLPLPLFLGVSRT